MGIMARIFISYRRADSQAWADRIYPVLAAAFGANNVFKDLDSIGLSRNFRAAIERAVIDTDVVLILIGRLWVTITDDQGRRLDNPDDFVRLEAEMALRHEKMVIPVVVDGARMPVSTDLPPSLYDLPLRNGAVVRGEPDFAHDMNRLIRSIKEQLSQQPVTPPAEAVVQSQIGVAAAAMEAEDYERAITILKAEQARNPTGRLARIITTMLSEAEKELTRQRYAAEAEREYRPIADLIQYKRTREQGCAELADFHHNYPDYDPDNLVQRCADYAAEQPRAAQEAERRTPRRLLPAALVVIVALGVVAVLLTSRSGGDSPTPTSPATDTPTQPNVADGTTPVARNADWTPVTRDFEGVAMVLVPAGCFMMGSDADAYYWDGGRYVRGVAEGGEQCFDAPFWIDKYEVTQAQFARFGGQQAQSPGFAGEQRPVERITWIEALDFCALRGARLPSEREWEYAARGPDGLKYPWGNEWDETKAVWAGNSDRQTAEVGSIPEGASWVGALDMSGNVWEWVSSIYRAYPYRADDGREDSANRTDSRVLRGGSWNYTLTVNLRAASRVRRTSDYWGNGLGFRCARSSE